LFQAWIAPSSRYPADKVIHAKAGRIGFIHWIKLWQNRHGCSKWEKIKEAILYLPLLMTIIIL